MRLALLSLVTLLLAACSTGTVIEKNVPGSPTPASKVGFIRKVRDAQGHVIGEWHTSEGHDTYNWLLGKYGKDLKPPRTADFGVTQHVGDEYFLNEEAIVDWGTMAEWSRSNEHQPKSLLQKATAL